MDKSLFFCLPFTGVSLKLFEVTTGNSKASYRFSASVFWNSLGKCPILCCFWKFKHTFGTKWDSLKKRGMLILEPSAGLKILHCISIKEARVSLCTSFLAVVEMWRLERVCSCVVVCTKEGVSSFICKRMWGDAGWDSLLAEWSTGEKRGLEKSTPDCWLFLCTIPKQCALHGCQQAIHWPSQYPSLNTSSFSLLLFPPCFPQFLHFSLSLFQLISRPANTVSLRRNKQMQVKYTENPEKCAP